LQTNIHKKYKQEYLIGDLIALIISFLAAMSIRFGYNWENIVPHDWGKWYVVAFGFVIFMNIVMMYFYRLYDMKYRFILSQIPKIVQAFIYSMLTFFILMFFLRNVQFSRLMLAYYSFIAIPLLIVFRFIMNRRIKKMFEAGIGVKKLLYVDLNEANVEVIKYLSQHKEFGIVVEGGLSKEGRELDELEILGTIDNYKVIIEAYDIDIILLSYYNDVTKDIITYCENNYIQIYMIPDLINLVSNPIDIGYINSVPLLTFRESRLTSFEGKLKRLTDFIFAFLGLVVVVPIMLVIGILIKMSSKGQILFKHKRLGMNGHYIYLYKFRTMVENADKVLEELFLKHPELKKEYEENFKLENDPRITKIGSFLRKTSLDELPQIFNILKGELSIVGPRPIVEAEIEKYGDYGKYILRVPPGLTGLWQVSGRSDINYNDRIQLDMYYINNWNFMLDITIILKTIPAVLARKGAY
jgi:exopolysaccharide biosynthesis polyprenyl glycosylphosphotransferase